MSDRIWFKKDMKAAILEGRKTRTTRDHLLDSGIYRAVSGSRFKAEVFAMLKLTYEGGIGWGAVLRDHYKEEGFDSPEQMDAWCKKNGLDYGNAKELFTYRLEVIQP